MQIRQLIAVLGLCLSQASALAVSKPTDRALQSFVMLMTPTDMSTFKNSPQFTNVVDALRHERTVDTHQLSYLWHHSVKPLISHHTDNMAEIYASVKGYHQTVEYRKAKNHPEVMLELLPLYRSCIYSNLKVIVEERPQNLTREKLAGLQEQLLRIFHPKSGVHHSSHPNAEIEEMFQDYVDNMFKIEPEEIKVMSTAEINEKLEEISKGIDPKPILITKDHYNEFMAQVYRDHSRPAAPPSPLRPVAVA